MPKRAVLAIAVLGLFATACITTTTPSVDYGQGVRFVPFVVDSTDDMGQGDAVALMADGSPYISYLGFPEKLAEGQIAVPRPIGSPSVPGVMLATADTTGLWQRGAVDMIEPTVKANGVAVPFGPVQTPNLDLTPQNSNGTAVALADDGTVHVAWVMGGGVYVATTKLGGSSSVEQVFDLGTKIDQAGPIGRPGLALDGGGNPWVAFTVETSKGREVHVVHADGGKWTDEVAAALANCNGCGSPQATGIGVVNDAPLVVYVDGATGTVGAATLRGTSWSASTVAKAPARGLAFATDGKGAYASYYGGDGTVQLATLAGGAWNTAKVADAADPTGSSAGNLAATTAVTVAGDGTVYVAWMDDGLHLASGTDTFAPVDLGHTTGGGVGPSLASSDKGIALSWYDTTEQNQMVGFVGDLQDLLVAQPSPSLTVSIGPPAGASCGKDGKPVLDVVAKGLAFDPTCLVALAGKPFDLNFDNEDASIPHNISIYTDSSATKALFTGDPITGVAKTAYKVDALDAGQYFFRCDIHPTMTGQFTVVKG